MFHAILARFVLPMPNVFQEPYLPGAMSSLGRLRPTAQSVAAACLSFAMTQRHLENYWGIHYTAATTNPAT